MFKLIAIFSVKPGSTETVRQLAAPLVAASRNDEGNISYEFCADSAHPGTFLFLETWSDDAALDKHNTTSHFQTFMKELQPYLAGEFAIHRIEL